MDKTNNTPFQKTASEAVAKFRSFAAAIVEMFVTMLPAEDVAAVTAALTAANEVINGILGELEGLIAQAATPEELLAGIAKKKRSWTAKLKGVDKALGKVKVPALEDLLKQIPDIGAAAVAEVAPAPAIPTAPAKEVLSHLRKSTERVIGQMRIQYMLGTIPDSVLEGIYTINETLRTISTGKKEIGRAHV